jgi:hypothetical protein
MQIEPTNPPPQAPAVGVPTNTMAIVSVVAGAASWLGFPLAAALVAIYCGHRARSELRQRGAAETGDGLAVAGLALGYTNVVGTIIGCVVATVVFGGFFAALAALGIVAESGGGSLPNGH